MKAIEKFWQTEEAKQITPEQRPFIEPLFNYFIQAYNQGVDDSMELVRKYGEIKQVIATEEFKLLLEFLEKSKETL